MAVEGTPVKPVAATSAADIELKGTRERKDGEKLLKGEHVIWEGTTWPMCCCSPLFCCTTIWTITNMKIDKKHGCCWMKEDTTDMRRVTDLACAAAAEPEKTSPPARHARAAAPPRRRAAAPPRRRTAAPPRHSTPLPTAARARDAQVPEHPVGVLLPRHDHRQRGRRGHPVDLDVVDAPGLQGPEGGLEPVEADRRRRHRRLRVARAYTHTQRQRRAKCGHPSACSLYVVHSSTRMTPAHYKHTGVPSPPSPALSGP